MGESASVASGNEVSVGHHEDLGHEALYFLFLCITLGAAARSAVRGTRLPYTVALLFLGLALGICHRYLDLGVLGNSLDVWSSIGPHTMLSCFLPALVFESAFSLEWHTFRRCAAQVLWLAGPGVLAGTALTGSLLKATLPYGWGWASSLMLGAILSATDPVAVVALLKEVGASKQLGHIIEGESLVNDGTAIVVFSLLNEIAKGAEKTPLQIFSFFVWVPVGALLVGLGIAAGCHAWLGSAQIAGDHLVQISVTLFACYLCFLVAEFQAAASGVLAVVVLGIAIGAFGRGFFTGKTEQSLHHFWEMLTFAANTVLFILTGVIIADTTATSTAAGSLAVVDLGWGMIVYLECLFVRATVMCILYPILRRCGYGLTPANAAVCVWGGLRGAVGLALALVVSEDSGAYPDQKVGPVVLLCTGVVVVLTLAVNGTTTAGLLQWLGLTRPEVSVQVALRRARQHIREQCMAVYHEHLTADDVMGTASFRVVSELVPFLKEDAAEEEEPETPAETPSAGDKAGKSVTASLDLNGDGDWNNDGSGVLDATSIAVVVDGVSGACGDVGRGLLTPRPSAESLVMLDRTGGEEMSKKMSDPSLLASALAVAAEEREREEHAVRERAFKAAVEVFERDIRGRFLAHVKVLYWEALEVGRATKEIVDTLVECTDIALDQLDTPLGDWRTLETRMLARAQCRSWRWRVFHALPPWGRRAVRVFQKWVLHSGAHPGGGARRRALVAVALFHDAHVEAAHAIFGPGAASSSVATLGGVTGGGVTGESADRSVGAEETAASRVRAESEADRELARSYLRAARTNEPELATAVKSEETARRLLAVAEKSAKGYVQSGLLTAVEAEELLAGIKRAKRALRLDPPEPITRNPRELMRVMPPLDPTHTARLHPLSLAAHLTSMADDIVLRHNPGSLISLSTITSGSLLLLARGLVEVTWTAATDEAPPPLKRTRSLGFSRVGSMPNLTNLNSAASKDVPSSRAIPSSSVAIRVGASSTSYGWALGAADLLVPAVARFDIRAVGAVTVFVVPPDVVEEMLACRGTHAALWRAAFGLLATTVLREELAHVPPKVLRIAATKSSVETHQPGEIFREAFNTDELVVLLKGELALIPGDTSDERRTIQAPCLVAVPKEWKRSDSGTVQVNTSAVVLRSFMDGTAHRRSLEWTAKRLEGRGNAEGEGRRGGRVDHGSCGNGGAAGRRQSMEFGIGGSGPGSSSPSIDEGDRVRGGSGDSRYSMSRRRQSLNIASLTSRLDNDNGRGSQRSSMSPTALNNISEGCDLFPHSIGAREREMHSEGYDLFPHSIDARVREMLSRGTQSGVSTGRMSLDVQSRAIAAEAASLAGSFAAGSPGRRSPAVGPSSGHGGGVVSSFFSTAVSFKAKSSSGGFNDGVANANSRTRRRSLDAGMRLSSRGPVGGGSDASRLDDSLKLEDLHTSLPEIGDSGTVSESRPTDASDNV